MRAASARGGTVANGQASFLVAQGEAFRLWTGAEPPADVMRTALAAHLGLPEEGLAVVGD
jgi:shikimate 5-dehydrogenase